MQTGASSAGRRSAQVARVAVALVALLAAAARPSAAHTRCPPPMGKFPFDAQLFSGEWYVVARTPMLKFPDLDTQCHKMEYTTSPHGNETRVSMKVTLKAGDKTLAPELMGRFGNRPNGGSVMQGVWRQSGDEKWKPGVFTMSVLVTDYNTYALTVSCKEMYFEESDSFERLLIPHVLSRTPQLEPTTLGVLKNIMTGMDVDEKDIKEQDNSGC